jgi:hypothetical protein
VRAVWASLLILVTILPLSTRALDLDVTMQDVERALAIARDSDGERVRFHAPYIRAVNLPFVESAEIVSEYRRVVLMAEERARKGDRNFGYSVTLAQQALGPWKHRVSLVARLRFHPQNTYVGVPPVDVIVEGRDAAKIGVLKEPILSLPSTNPGDRLPVLGATVEGVFDAVSLGQGPHEFVIRLDGREIGRVTFDLGALQ